MSGPRDSEEKREQGVRFFADVMGSENADGMRREIAEQRRFGSETATFSADFAFGTIWERPGLARRERSLVVLGMLMALRQTDEIKYHVRIALANGLTVAELEEVLYQALPYAGFPAANTAKVAMTEALRELGELNQD
ncbi:MAG TPA: carboxymuconolactone decarboxylase family protein [Sphingobium sp.]|uniref:carboxymuconolactone decarboxylase family protein n=1 Tax=Sphingobium sp. TaxID=1912891 RepID=UPI002ED1E476